MLSRTAFRPRNENSHAADQWKRCPPFLRWLRGRPCFLSIHAPSQHQCWGKVRACHFDPWGDKGTGTKVSDCACMPMCDGAHAEQGDVLGLAKVPDEIRVRWPRCGHGLLVGVAGRNADGRGLGEEDGGSIVSDKEPILIRKAFGALRAVTPAAEELVASLQEGKLYRIEVHNIRGNTKRLALYWVCLKKACELLSDAVDGVLNRKALHRWLKREEGLAKPIISRKTGEIIDYDYESIAFDNMPENERARFIDAALERISRRLQCDVTQLRQEGENEMGEAA